MKDVQKRLMHSNIKKLHAAFIEIKQHSGLTTSTPNAGRVIVETDSILEIWQQRITLHYHNNFPNVSSSFQY